MEPPSQADLVCLYLDAVAAGSASAPATGDPIAPPRTVQGISTALDLDRGSTAHRIGVLSTLETLQEEGLVTSEETAVGGTTRTRFRLTDEGRRRARDVRERFERQRVTVTNGTTEEVLVADLDQYFDGPPLVRALARLDDDGEIRLREDLGGEFVDREAELDRLRDALSTVTQRGSRTVLVSGEAGVGKTALVEKLLADARRQGFRVCTGRCRQSGDRPYGPLLSAFRDLPDPEGLVATLETAAADPTDPEAYEARRRALFDDVTDALVERGSEDRLVLFLDDLQWAGRDTRDLFVHLAASIDEWISTVLFVATYRSEAAATDEGFEGLVSLVGADERTEHVELGPLPEAESYGLVAWLADRPDLPETFLETIRERTGGNPLLIRETVQQLVDDGHLEPDAPLPSDPGAWPVPEGVSPVVESRLRQLPDRTREVLAATAVVGETADPGLVAAVLGADESTVNDHLDALATGGFLDRTGDGVAFVGGLVREAILDQLDPERRRALEGGTAEAIQRVYPDAVERRAARIAHHYEAAGDPAAAVDHYRTAGDRAREVYANEEAVDAYERALELGRHHPGTDDRTLAAVAAEIGEVYQLTGDYERARERVEAGLEMAPGDAPERCRLLGTLAATYLGQGDYDDARNVAERQRDLAATFDAREYRAEAFAHLGRAADGQSDYEAARDQFEAALAIYRDLGDRHGEARTLRHLGTVVQKQGEYDRAREYHEEALPICREVGARAEEARVLDDLGLIAQRRDEYDLARDRFEAALSICREIGARAEAARVLSDLGGVAQRQAEYERARERFEAALEIHREVGARAEAATTLDSLGTVAQRQGRYDQAREHFEASLAIDREIGNRAGEADTLIALGNVAQRQGRYDRARERYEGALSIAREIGALAQEATALNVLGSVAQLNGEYDRAREYYEESLDLFRELGSRSNVATTLTNLGLIAQNGGEYDRAREYHEESLAICREIGDRSGEGTALNVLGGVAGARGEYDRARDCYEAALAVFREIGDRQGEANVLDELGTVARRRGAYDRAGEYHRESLDIAREIGARTTEAAILVHLGRLARRRGAHDRAREHFEDGLDVAREIGRDAKVVESLAGLGALARQRGEYDRAGERFETALDVSAAGDDPLETARIALERALLALDRGDHGTARDLATDARETFANLGAAHFEARAELVWGRVAAGSGFPDEAREHWRAALETFESVGAPQDALRTLRHLVDTSREAGDVDAAREWRDLAREILDGAPDPVAERHRGWVRRQGSTSDQPGT